MALQPNGVQVAPAPATGAAPARPTEADGYTSGATKRIVLFFLLGFPVLMFGAASLRALQLADEGEVPVEWRDLDCDGKVSKVEWLRGGIDFRLRPSTLVPGCQEVFHAKRGEAAVVRCPSEPRCRLAKGLLPAGQ